MSMPKCRRAQLIGGGASATANCFDWCFCPGRGIHSGKDLLDFSACLLLLVHEHIRRWKG
eukprot:scaffold89713_cov19-Tisochrysis_lutea.AAC.3